MKEKERMMKEAFADGDRTASAGNFCRSEVWGSGGKIARWYVTWFGDSDTHQLKLSPCAACGPHTHS